MDLIFKEQSDETFMQVVEDVLKNLYVSDQGTLQDTNKSLKEDIRDMILMTNFNISEITLLLNSKGYHESRVKSFVSLLEKRKNELVAQTLIHHNCKYGESLSNFDWKLKLVCGTSQMKTMPYYPLLQLLLHTVTSQHMQAKTLYELNETSVVRLIEALEEVVGDTKDMTV